jgi:hypothetical protein
MTKGNLQKAWQEKVNQFKASGKTQAVWCIEQEINVRTFNYWYVKFKEPAPTKENLVNWLPIKVEKMNKEKLRPSFNIKIGTAIIEVSQGFNPKLLAEVVNVLSELC